MTQAPPQLVSSQMLTERIQKEDSTEPYSTGIVIAIIFEVLPVNFARGLVMARCVCAFL